MSLHRNVITAYGARIAEIRDGVAAVEHSTTTAVAIAMTAGDCRRAADCFFRDGRTDLSDVCELLADLLEEERTIRMDPADRGGMDLPPESNSDRGARRARLRAVLSGIERDAQAWLTQETAA